MRPAGSTSSAIAVGGRPDAANDAAWSLGPTVTCVTLGHGARLVWADRRTSPLLHLKAIVPAGATDDPSGLDGLAALTAPLLQAGAGGRTASALADEAEALGADVITRAGWQESAVAVELLASDAAIGARLLADLLWEPSFETDACERFRQRRLARLRQVARDPREIADDAFARAVFGDTREGRPLVGTDDSVARIDSSHLADFHRQRFTPHGTVIVAVGGADLDPIARELDRAGMAARLPLRSPDAGDPARVPPAPAHAPAHTPAPAAFVARAIRIDRPGARQTFLRVGHAAPARHHPELTAVELLAALLAARLDSTLRHVLGHTYGVQAEVSARGAHAALSLGLAIADERADTVAPRVAQAMALLQRQPAEAHEIAGVRQRLTGAFVRSLQPAHGLAAHLERLLGEPAVDRWRELQALARLDSLDLREIARRHLHPEGLVVVAVGPAPPTSDGVLP